MSTNSAATGLTKRKLGCASGLPIRDELTPAVVERFWSLVEIRGPGDCWRWNGALTLPGVNSGLRYGTFGIGASSYRAHRVSWTITNGEIPKGHVIAHSCDVPRCVNPRHLFLGSPMANVRDMIGKRRHNNLKKTHCPQGHPYKGKHLGVRPNGWRYCKTCAALRSSGINPTDKPLRPQPGNTVVSRDKIPELLRMREQGSTLRAISAHFGISKSRVSVILKREAATSETGKDHG